MRDRFVRWVIAGGCTGLVVGAVLGTAQWPFVGTFFLGIRCMAYGAAAGAAAGLVLRSVQVPSVPGLPIGIGTAFGAWAGAIAGLTIGLHVYPATAAVAAVEGAVFGAVPGCVLGIGVALVTAARRR